MRGLSGATGGGSLVMGMLFGEDTEILSQMHLGRSSRSVIVDARVRSWSRWWGP